MKINRVALLLLLLFPLSGWSQPFLQGKISDPRFTEGRISEPKTQHESLNALFTYASAFFSDMIYGRTFVYYPTHNDRKIKSRFEWSAQIEPENPKKISVFDIERDEIFMTAWFRYDMTPNEKKRVESRTPEQLTSAAASASLFENDSPLPMLDVYFKVCEEAVKKAAKSTIQKRKPKEIHGRLILEKMPSVSIRSGSYTVQASFRIGFDRIEYFDYF